MQFLQKRVGRRRYGFERREKERENEREEELNLIMTILIPNYTWLGVYRLSAIKEHATEYNNYFCISHFVS